MPEDRPSERRGRYALMGALLEAQKSAEAELRGLEPSEASATA